MRWWKGISTGIAWRRPIAEVLPAIAREGFRLIEVATARPHLTLGDPGAIDELSARIEDLGLAVHSLHAPFAPDLDFTDPDPRVRGRTFDELERAADALERLGGRHYVVHPGGENDRWEDRRRERLGRSVGGLSRLWEVCRSRRLVLTVENPLPHLLGGHIDDFESVVDQLPVAGTGVCLDTSHGFLAGDLTALPERLGSRLVHLQASDNHGRHDDHLPPGDGRIPWRELIRALKRADYDGPFLLEVRGGSTPEQDVRRAADALRRLSPEGLAAPGR